MLSRLKISLFSALLFLSLAGFSQGNRQYITNKMFWSETVVVGKIKGKFNYQLDYQYRRSADPSNKEGGNHHNLFKNPLQQVVRPWLHYQPNDGIRFSLSPIGWWGTWTAETNALTFFPEFRITPQITLNQKLGRLVISQRYRYEFRFQGDKKEVSSGWNAGTGYDHLGDDMHTKSRFRYFVRGLLPLGGPTLTPGSFYIDTYNEIFLNFGAAIKNTNLFDQNRFFAGLGYRFNTDIRIEMGYLSQTAFRFNNAQQNNVEQNNILQVLIFFDNFNKFFQNKKKEEVFEQK